MKFARIVITDNSSSQGDVLCLMHELINREQEPFCAITKPILRPAKQQQNTKRTEEQEADAYTLQAILKSNIRWRIVLYIGS
jgi:hypothetical protein